MNEGGAEAVKALEKFSHFRLSKKDLEAMDSDSRSLVILSCYAATETNLLSKMYLMACHDFVDDELADYMNIAQRLLILRTWSAKLFEFIDLIELTNKRKNLAEVARVCLNESTEEISELKSHGGYYVARNLRHEATSHYSDSAAVKNFAFASPKDNYSFYLHEMEGNSYFALGDTVMVAGRLNRQGKNISDLAEQVKLYDDWYAWNLDAQKWLKRAHLSIMKKLVVEPFSGRRIQEKTHWLPVEMVGMMKSSRIPLVLRNSKK